MNFLSGCVNFGVIVFCCEFWCEFWCGFWCEFWCDFWRGFFFWVDGFFLWVDGFFPCMIYYQNKKSVNSEKKSAPQKKNPRRNSHQNPRRRKNRNPGQNSRQNSRQIRFRICSAWRKNSLSRACETTTTIITTYDIMIYTSILW